MSSSRINGAAPKAAATPAAGSPGQAALPPVIRTISDVRQRLADCRREGKTVALVPTMGYFHEGHLSLMRAAREEAGFVAVTIFVNPIQFGPTEDFENYPRDLDNDLVKAGAAGVDMVFVPETTELYPAGHETLINVGSIAEGLCGQGRPGHFDGVATIVAKFFNIFRPEKAYFGQKDAQQAAVIRKMVKDLDFDVEIRVCPIVREPDGLAMSSRNSYLEPEPRQQATALYLALEEARERVAAGETSVRKIKRKMQTSMAANYLVELEYVKFVDPETLEPVKEITGDVLVAVAAKVGKPRLIDNMVLSPKEN